MATPLINSMQGGAFALTAKTEFPGLSEKQRSWIFDKTKEEDEQLKKQKQYDLYKQVLPVTIANKKLQERIDAKQELLYATQTEKDETKKNTQKLTLKLADLADTMREDALKKGFDLTDKTDDVLVGQLVNKAPNGKQMLTDYINGVNEDILIKTGLKTEEIVENKEDKMQGVKNIVGGAYDSATGLPRFIAENLAKGVGRIAEKLGADETKVQELVDSYINSLKDFSGEAIGADTESGLYKGTKIVGDIAQIANPAGLGKAGIKAGQIASKVAKEGSLLSKVAKGAVEGAVDTAVFMPQSEQRMATGKELAIGAVAGGTIPIAGVGLNAAKKGLAKVAPKLELSGLLNPSKLNTVKEKLIQEGVDKADALDVGKWMLDRNIKGSKSQIIGQLDNIANQSRTSVDDVLAKSQAKYKNATANDLLGKLAQEYDGSISQTGRDKYDKIVKLIKKNKTEGLNLTELNEVKRMVRDLDPFTATGKVKVSKSDLAGANSELKKFIEKEASNTIEGVDENMIKMLNNETQIAKGLSEGIARKESADASREIINFLAGRSPGAIIGGTLGYQQGGDWKSVIVGALVGGAVGSTKVKTNAANILNKVFSKQEQTVLQKFIKSGGAEKLSPKIINKLDDVAKQVEGIKETATHLKASVKNESITRPVVRVKAPEEPLIAEARKYKSAEEFVDRGFTYKTNKKLYRGLANDKSQRTELGFATLGKGIYTTFDKSFAKKFGNVIEMDKSVYLPRNPLIIERPGQPASSALKDWIIDRTGLKRISEFHSKYGEDYSIYLQKLGYDGAVIGDEIVKFGGPTDLSQLKQIREEANKTKGLQMKASDSITSKELSKKFTGRDKDFSDLSSEKIEPTLERISKDWTKSKIDINKLEYDYRGDFFEQQDISKKKVSDIYNKIKKGEEIPPIMINQQGAVIDGNHRVIAYKLAGKTDIPVYMPSNTNIEKINNLGTRTQGYSKLFDDEDLFMYKDIIKKGLPTKK